MPSWPRPNGGERTLLYLTYSRILPRRLSRRARIADRAYLADSSHHNPVGVRSTQGHPPLCGLIRGCHRLRPSARTACILVAIEVYWKPLPTGIKEMWHGYGRGRMTGKVAHNRSAEVRGERKRSNARLLLSPLLAALLCACQSAPTRTPPPGGIAAPLYGTGTPASPRVLQGLEYDVRASLTLVNEGPGQPSKQNLWMALIRDLPPYQTVRSMRVTPAAYTLVTDEYGNRYAEFDLSNMPPGSTVPIQVDYRVAVHEPLYELGECKGDLPSEFTQAELHVESNNPQIVELSRELSEGKDTMCEQVRAMYDWVGNQLVYSYNGADWGAQAALGEMGADCTEYASLLMALARASGIPARYSEGLWAGGENAPQEGRTEHAWLEVYLPGAGWVPMDPTLGRSSLGREAYFAHLPPDHIIVTRGRNPSTLRGASYWSHIYWPGTSTTIRVEGFQWEVTLVGK